MIAIARTTLGCMVALMLVHIVVRPSHARPPMTIEEARIAACIKKASRGSAWLEKTLWGLRDQEGGWIGAEVANTNGTRDLGPMQVNSWWVPRIARALSLSQDVVQERLRLDPCFNVETARWIFVSAIGARRSYWEAVGAYHSPTSWRARRYALSVAGHLRLRYGADVFRPSP